MSEKTKITSARCIVFTCGFVVLGGCASSYPGGVHPADSSQKWGYSGSTVTYLPDDAGPKLESATVGQQIRIGDTLWGASTALVVENRYFAASGKPCLAAEIKAEGEQQKPVNVCKYANGKWGATKAIRENTRNGGVK
jgi:common-antigen outer membrane protein